MNILLLNINIGSTKVLGGIESHSEILASSLALHGHRVVVGCRDAGTIRVSNDLLLPARKVVIRNSGDVLAMIRIVRICREEGIDLVIANIGKEYWPATLAAIYAGCKIIFIRHQTDKIRHTTRWLIRNHVHKVIAVSRAVRDVLLRDGVPEEKVALIYNGISLEKFNPVAIDREAVRDELGIMRGDVVVGTMVKLIRGKGIFEFLYAGDLLAKENRGIKLLFVGEGPELEGLEKETQRLLMTDRVIFAGGRKDPERMYAAMDVFVLASTCSEAFGLVLAEAMAMEKPVVATKTGGIPEVVEDGKTGLLVPPGNSDAIASAVTRYLNYPEFAQEIAENGRNMVTLRFSDKAMGNCYSKVIEALEVKG